MLGIDPGTAVTGYGVVEPTNGRPGRLVECGVIRTSAKEEVWRRLDALYQGISELIARHEPSALAVESIFYGKNVRTTVVLGQARGVILLAGARAGLDIAEFPPAQVKQSILNSLHSQQNAKALIEMARAEKDPKLKLRIVERISDMAGRSKEAADYLAELLK